MFILDLLFITAIGGGLLTQIAIPFVMGRPLFPAFTHRDRKLEQRLEQARRQVLDAELQKDIVDIEQYVDETRRYGRPPADRGYNVREKGD